MGKTIQEQIRMAGRQRLPWSGMSIDDMERACAVIDSVAAEFGDARTYNPATHIVVSRKAGEHVAKIIEYDVCGRENCKCGELAAELRAALEGE